MSGVPICDTKELFKDRTPQLTRSNLLAILGPVCIADEAVMAHALTMSNKLHWAVNTCSRERIRVHLSSESSHTTTVCSGQNTFMSKEPQIVSTELLELLEGWWHLVFEWLDCKSLLSVHKSSRKGLGFFSVTSSDEDRLWLRLLFADGYIFDTREGATPPGSVLLFRGLGMEIGENEGENVLYVGKEGFFPENSARQHHNTCRGLERRRHCFHCLENEKVVPVVYGFPSNELVTLQKAGKIRMFGDYLLEGAATWTCLGCSAEYLGYPWRINHLDMQPRERKRAPSGLNKPMTTG